MVVAFKKKKLGEKRKIKTTHSDGWIRRVPLLCSPLKYTHTVRTKDGNEKRKKNQIRGFLFFPFLGIKRKKKDPSDNPNASKSLPNSEEEAGLARKRRGRRGETTFCLFLPKPSGFDRRTVKISHYEGKRRLPVKKNPEG